MFEQVADKKKSAACPWKLHLEGASLPFSGRGRREEKRREEKKECRGVVKNVIGQAFIYPSIVQYKRTSSICHHTAY